MQKLLEGRAKAIALLKDESHIRAAVLGLMRITLQHACVCLGEWIAVTLRADSGKQKDFTGVELKNFQGPADGELISLLSELLVAVENLGWRSAGRQYWEQFALSDPLKRLLRRPKANVETLLFAFVRERNNGVEGHGLAGGYDSEMDQAVIAALIHRVAPFLPVVAKDGSTLSMPELGGRPATELQTLRLFDGDPICYRHIRQVAGGRVRVEAQIQRTLLKRDDVSYEAPNVLLDIPVRASPQYDIFEPTWDAVWQPFIYVPERVTSAQEFTGRALELSKLVEWADDEDSRRCMVYGDGGQGKTTLVLEFVYRMLEGRAGVSWRPSIITFYTAKKTRWGLSGLEHISAQDIGVADVAVDIARMLLTDPLDRSWFDRSPKEVVQKLAGLQSEMGVKRDQHLIILDNTETMAKNDADVVKLASQINELSKHVGRVILTSRRREQIEAYPVQTESWSDDEGGDFIRKRGRNLACRSINDAGLATLKGYSRKLGNKPIALEVFVQAAAAQSSGLDKAFQRVQQMQRQDLGQFLYDDAWDRMEPEMRHVLLLMSRVSDTVDQYIIQLCCQRAGVTVASASEAIEESKGIGTVSRIQGILQVAFNVEFFNYCAERSVVIDGKTLPTEDDIDWVRRRYAEFIASASAQVRDRNLKAYRVPSARAAWSSFTAGNAEAAFEHYEAATREDPENGFLYDRYAYSLFNQKRYAPALDKAKHATVLLPMEAEVWFTRGIVEARLGLRDDAIEHLGKAERLGKAKHLCELQRAYAHVYAEPKDMDEARHSLDRALKNAPKDKFLDRFIAETTGFQRRWFPT